MLGTGRTGGYSLAPKHSLPLAVLMWHQIRTAKGSECLGATSSPQVRPVPTSSDHFRPLPTTLSDQFQAPSAASEKDFGDLGGVPGTGPTGPKEWSEVVGIGRNWSELVSLPLAVLMWHQIRTAKGSECFGATSSPHGPTSSDQFRPLPTTSDHFRPLPTTLDPSGQFRALLGGLRNPSQRQLRVLGIGPKEWSELVRTGRNWSELGLLVAPKHCR